MPSNAHSHFTKLVRLVDQLITIHGRIQQGRGRRHQQDAIHRAGVVMMVAAWEAYIEKVVVDALNAVELGIGGGAAATGTMPAWVQAAFAMRRAEIEESIRRFHTPNAERVQELLCGLSLGFDPWPHWSWHVGPRQWDAGEMRSRLNAWLRIRHSIAHGSALPNNIAWLHDHQYQPRLTLQSLRECRKFFERLVVLTDAAFSAFLRDEYGIPLPW